MARSNVFPLIFPYLTLLMSMRTETSKIQWFSALLGPGVIGRIYNWAFLSWVEKFQFWEPGKNKPFSPVPGSCPDLCGWVSDFLWFSLRKHIKGVWAAAGTLDGGAPLVLPGGHGQGQERAAGALAQGHSESFPQLSFLFSWLSQVLLTFFQALSKFSFPLVSHPL